MLDIKIIIAKNRKGIIVNRAFPKNLFESAENACSEKCFENAQKFSLRPVLQPLIWTA